MEETLTIYAKKNASNEDLIFLDNSVSDYVVSYDNNTLIQNLKNANLSKLVYFKANWTKYFVFLITTGKKATAEELAEEYFYKQYSYAEICQTLFAKHGVRVSIKILQRYFAQKGLKRKNIIETDTEQLIAAVLQEVLSSGKYWAFTFSTILLTLIRNYF